MSEFDDQSHSVLIFPPISNRRRFLIHKVCEDLRLKGVATFSIGVGDGRRTVVCYESQLLSVATRSVMGIEAIQQSSTQKEFAAADERRGTLAAAAGHGGSKSCGGAGGGDNVYRPPHARHQEKTLRAQERSRDLPAKPRRPDRAVYVPRAKRLLSSGDAETKSTPKHEMSQPTSPVLSTPEARKDECLPQTPKKLVRKGFCNVYTPPHARSHDRPDDKYDLDNGDTSSNDASVNLHSVPCDQSSYSVPNGSVSVDISANETNCSNGDGDDVSAVIPLVDVAMNETNQRTTEPVIIEEVISCERKKDDDIDDEASLHSTAVINHINRRIIKQPFVSDVLVISDPIDEQTQGEDARCAKVPLSRDDNDWDTLFDDDGECLDPTLLAQLTETVGKVHIHKPKTSYEQYQTRGQIMLSGPEDEMFSHVLEVYNFPQEFKTHDLLSVFSTFKDTGFEIKWVDDTHALAVFSSAKIAAEVMAYNNPMVRTRPLHEATPDSRMKARRSAEFLQPYRPRPETCTALARRLVTGALGVKLSTAREERLEERRIIREAREKKKQAALQREAAWEGTLENQIGNHS